MNTSSATTAVITGGVGSTGSPGESPPVDVVGKAVGIPLGSPVAFTTAEIEASSSSSTIVDAGGDGGGSELVS